MTRWFPISNDLMFKHVFGEDAELCRRLIELALDTPISSIEFVQPQRESAGAVRAGSVYFDVMAIAADGTSFDVEMQATTEPSISRRARLYLSRLTVDSWRRVLRSEGTHNYGDLPAAAVIFVCGGDPIGGNAGKYTYRLKCKETNTYAEDGARVVFLNARGNTEGMDSSLAAFLRYVAGDGGAAAEDDFVRAVDRRVAEGNADEEFMEGAMDLEEKLWRSREEGREEGLEQGREEGLEHGRELTARLAIALAQDGKESELPHVLADKDLFEKSLREYGLS